MKYAFITGMGRSGTKFLTALLSQSKNAVVKHEHIGNREFWLLSWYLDKNAYTIPYLENEKDNIESGLQKELFIDVNSRLQNSVPELEKVFQTQNIYHLVRDPRKVIPSLYSRRSENNVHQVPKNETEFRIWLKSDKLYQVCWNWADTTKRLLKQNTTLIRFEDLLTDYGYLNKNLLSPLQLNDIDETKWSQVKSKKVNQTLPSAYRYLYSLVKKKDFVSESLPEFNEWDSKSQQMLFDVCGEVMNLAGYRI